MANTPQNGPPDFGDYKRVEFLGGGGEGRVFRAVCLADNNPRVAMNQTVALKILKHQASDERALEKFRKQTDTLMGVQHPNIVRYLDRVQHIDEFGEEHLCVVMEFLGGHDLKTEIATRGALPWDEVRTIFEQCLEALVYAAARGIFHRDLKPSNIYLIGGGVVKLIDFGIAHFEDGGATTTGGFKGSFDYMAPDVVLDEQVFDYQARDVFSLGVCLYEATVGAMPFPRLGEGAQGAFYARWKKEQPQLKFPDEVIRRVFKVYPRARELLEKCLAIQRSERYATFEEVLQALRRVKARSIRHKDGDIYECVEWIGRGGFGEVYKARRQRDGQVVAIKKLTGRGGSSDRFVREAQMLQRLNNPHIVRYVDFLESRTADDEREYYLILEFLEGMPEWSLRGRIGRPPKALPTPEVLELFDAYLQGLQALHDNPHGQIIHRDIKPGNLYAPEGHPSAAKIFDLGVVRDVEGQVTTGPIPGTPDYMPPEFGDPDNENRGSPESDLYSLGLCLYEALTGDRVFPPLPTDPRMSWSKFTERSGAPPTLRFDQPVFRKYPGLCDVLRTCLAFRPRQRYQSAVAMRLALKQAVGKGLEEPVSRTQDTALPVGGGEEETIAILPEQRGPAVAAAPRAPAPPEESSDEAPTPDATIAAPERVQPPVRPEPVVEPAPPPRPSVDLPIHPETAPEPVAAVPPKTQPVAVPVTPAPGLAELKWTRPEAQPERKPIPHLTGIIVAAVLIIAALGALAWGIPRLRERMARSQIERLAARLDGEAAPAASYVNELAAVRSGVQEWKASRPDDETVQALRKKFESVRAALPAVFSNACFKALDRKDDTAASKVADEWAAASAALADVGIDEEQIRTLRRTMEDAIQRLRRNNIVAALDDRVRDFESRMPSPKLSRLALDGAEKLLGEIQELKAKPLPGVSDAERDEKLDPFVKTLVAQMNVYLKELPVTQAQLDELRKDYTNKWPKLTLNEGTRPTYDSVCRNMYNKINITKLDDRVSQVLEALRTSTTPAALASSVENYVALKAEPLTDTHQTSLAEALDQGWSNGVAAVYRDAVAAYRRLDMAAGDKSRKEIEALKPKVTEAHRNLSAASTETLAQLTQARSLALVAGVQEAEKALNDSSTPDLFERALTSYVKVMAQTGVPEQDRTALDAALKKGWATSIAGPYSGALAAYGRGDMAGGDAARDSIRKAADRLKGGPAILVAAMDETLAQLKQVRNGAETKLIAMAVDGFRAAKDKAVPLPKTVGETTNAAGLYVAHRRRLPDSLLADKDVQQAMAEAGQACRVSLLAGLTLRERLKERPDRIKAVGDLLADKKALEWLDEGGALVEALGKAQGTAMLQVGNRSGQAITLKIGDGKETPLDANQASISVVPVPASGVRVAVRADAGIPGFQPQQTSVMMSAGGGDEWWVETFETNRIAVRYAASAVSSGMPPVKVSYRPKGSGAPADWPAGSSVSLLPGEYEVVFRRDDYENVLQPLSVKLGSAALDVVEPKAGDWRPTEALTALLLLREQRRKGDWLAIATALATPAPALQWTTHRREYEDIKDQCAAALADRLSGEVATAEDQVAAFTASLYQMDDPTVGRLGAVKPPALRLALSKSYSRAMIPKAELWAQYVRLLAWQEEAPGLATPNDPAFARLSAKLGQLAATHRTAAPEQARRCDFESRLLVWDLQALPDGSQYEAGEWARWWAHASYVPGELQSDTAKTVVQRLARFAKEGRPDAKDATLALCAAYKCLGNYIQSIQEATAGNVAPEEIPKIRARKIEEFRVSAMAVLENLTTIMKACDKTTTAKTVAFLMERKGDQDILFMGRCLGELPAFSQTGIKEGVKGLKADYDRVRPEDWKILQDMLR